MNELIEKVKQFLFNKPSKDQHGITVDGVYFEESDPAYPVACAVLGARRVTQEVTS